MKELPILGRVVVALGEFESEWNNCKIDEISSLVDFGRNKLTFGRTWVGTNRLSKEFGSALVGAGWTWV